MKKNSIIIALILFILIQIPFMMYIWYPYQVQQDFNLQTIPVASNDLSMRHTITTQDIDWISVPASFIQDWMIIDEQLLVNHVVSNKVFIPKGSYFVNNAIYSPLNIPDQPAQELDYGQTAFSFDVNFIQVAGNTLVENQKVDLYTVIQQRNEPPIVDLLISAVRIIDLRDYRGLELTDENSTKIAAIITLALNKEYIPLLLSAQEVGTIQLYATDASWDNTQECILNEKSKILPLLTNEHLE